MKISCFCLYYPDRWIQVLGSLASNIFSGNSFGPNVLFLKPRGIRVYVRHTSSISCWNSMSVLPEYLYTRLMRICGWRMSCLEDSYISLSVACLSRIEPSPHGCCSFLTRVAMPTPDAGTGLQRVGLGGTNVWNAWKYSVGKKCYSILHFFFAVAQRMSVLIP